MEHKAEQTAKHGKPGHSKAIGYLCAAVGAATFGLIPLFANTAILAGIHNDTILAYRYSIAALSYALYLLLRRKSLRISHSQAKEVLLAGVFGYGITATFLMASYLYMPTGIATSIHFLYPVVVTILMAVFYKTKTPVSQKAAIGLAILGVGMLSWTGGGIKWVGMVFVLLSTLTYGGYIVALNRPAIKAMDPGVFTFWALAGSALFYLAMAASRGHLAWIPDPHILLNLLLLGIVSTTVSARLTVAAVNRIGSVPASIFGTLEPITAILTGILVFHESFSGLNLTGFVLVTASVLLVMLLPGKSSGVNIH